MLIRPMLRLIMDLVVQPLRECDAGPVTVEPSVLPSPHLPGVGLQLCVCVCVCVVQCAHCIKSKQHTKMICAILSSLSESL